MSTAAFLTGRSAAGNRESHLEHLAGAVGIGEFGVGAQLILAGAMTDDGNSLIELVYDALGDDIIAMLDLSDSTRKLIEAS